jgi:hypothetical protein
MVTQLTHRMRFKEPWPHPYKFMTINCLTSGASGQLQEMLGIGKMLDHFFVGSFFFLPSILLNSTFAQ